MQAVTRAAASPRRAQLRDFLDPSGAIIDRGIVLFFPGPASFTGEDVAELQGHGGPVVMDLLLEACLSAGARFARPGEFSERAFVNGKLDLVQAEAVADLIASASKGAARAAMRSLSGDFSRRITELAEAVLNLRIFVEAAIDFPEEEVDFLSTGNVKTQLDDIAANLATLIGGATQGALRTEGWQVVIAGRPNAGKSSLLNRLAGSDRAIVTDVPGTTRDVLRERIDLGGLPLIVVDTAGLRASLDRVEQEGVRRARAEVSTADHLLLVCDPLESEDPLTLINQESLDHLRLTVVENKTDLSGLPVGIVAGASPPRLRLSALTGAGFEALEAHLKAVAGYRDDEGGFSARRRHLDGLRRAQDHVERARAALSSMLAGELVAEDLRAAHQALGEIVGETTSDDLLGAIFASFCIGK